MPKNILIFSDGTAGGRWRQSQATGLGISWNIADCYDALIRMYEPGDAEARAV